MAEHHREQVVDIVATAGPVAGDQLVEERVQGRQLVGECRRHPVLEDFAQRCGEACRDGRHTGDIERLEPGTETGQRNGVHRQFLQIGGHVDRVMPRGGVPPADQLSVDVEHRGVIVAQPRIAEARQQDIMGLLPVGFAVERGEQPVAGQGTDPGQRRGEVLGEAGLVAEFLDQWSRACVELPFAVEVGVEQGPVQFSEQVDRKCVGTPGQEFRPG